MKGNFKTIALALNAALIFDAIDECPRCSVVLRSECIFVEKFS